jgi:membrane protein
VSDLLAFLWRFGRLWQRALLFTRAGSLTFASILAIVPLMVMLMAFLSLSPFSTALKPSIERFLFANFVPSSSQMILGYLQHFTDQAWQMSWWSIGFLMVAALKILFSLEDDLNAIWQIPSRRYWHSLIIYGLLLILSPFFLVCSFVLSLPLLPLLCSFAAFVTVFKLLPNTHVRWDAALMGAAWAASIFEVAKYGFAWYVTAFPSYERIYGIAAALPLFFLWLYCAWLIMFFGALIAFFWQSFFDKPKGGTRVDAAKPLSGS